MKEKNKIKDLYFKWLYSQIEKRDLSGLENFVFELHSYPFICHVPNDDNRVEEGIGLRYKFADEENINLLEDTLSGSCTLLEMLVALADRMDFILFDPSKGNRRWLWFWLFIDNLKLQKYTNDDNEGDVSQKRKFNRIVINKFLRREYLANGKGGLFPLENPYSDQREVEIWYQMSAYISENYDT
jgi:hypothetical protein